MAASLDSPMIQSMNVSPSLFHVVVVPVLDRVLLVAVALASAAIGSDRTGLAV